MGVWWTPGLPQVWLYLLASTNTVVCAPRSPQNAASGYSVRAAVLPRSSKGVGLVPKKRLFISSSILLELLKVIS